MLTLLNPIQKGVAMPDDKKKAKKTSEKKTIQVPSADIELLGEGGFRIRLKKLKDQPLIDQSGDTLLSRGQGCISNPNGPRC
jgi:hypothetical protein